jgi:hypothetical protein
MNIYWQYNINEEIISQYKEDWLSGQTLDIYIPSKKK